MRQGKISDAELRAALIEVLNAPIRPPALRPISWIKYLREISILETDDHEYPIMIRLAKWGFEYKHRGPRPATPPEIDEKALQRELQQEISKQTHRIIIGSVRDDITHIEIYLKVIERSV